MTYGHPSKWHTEAHRPLSVGYNYRVLKKTKRQKSQKVKFFKN